jgi:F420H(2)-dependent quinone reductase
LTDRSVPDVTSTAAAEAPTTDRSPWLPPRWFIKSAWVAHRAVHRLTGRRRGLAPPRADGQFGYLRLVTVGRRSGRMRAAILGFVEDGANLVTLAMNGWGDDEPAWWLNLQVAPDATVELKGGTTRAVRARAATGDERDRLWELIKGHQGWGDIDAFARRRSGETAVVVFAPRGA